MRARSAYVSSRATPGARKHRSTGLNAAMRCIWVALPTSLPMSAIYGATLAVRGGRPKPPIHSPQHAMHMVSRRHSLPRTTTPRPGSTTTPRPRDRLHTFYRSVARGCSSQTPRMPLRMPHGRNCQIATCIGLPSIPGKADAGGRSGYACAAMPPLMKTIPCYSTCQNHGPASPTAPLALDLREVSRGWVCCRGSPPEVLPCPGERVPLPHPPQPPLVGGAPAQPALVSTAPSTEAGWFNQGPRDNLAAGNTNSWLFVPLLHAADGRLHPSALAAWEAHAHYALLWRGALGTLRQAPHVAPAALVHALHTLQQLAAQEGRALPVPEA